MRPCHKTLVQGCRIKTFSNSILFLHQNFHKAFFSPSLEEILTTYLDEVLEELMTQISHVVATLTRKHESERIQLLVRREGYLPYGVSAWAKHKTFNENYIVYQLKLQEILFNDLKAPKSKTKNIFEESNSDTPDIPIK